jgi:hypothetical protein
MPRKKALFMVNMSWQKKIKENIPGFSKASSFIPLNGIKTQKKLKHSISI